MDLFLGIFSPSLGKGMGLIFVIPFLWFLRKGWIPSWLGRRLGWVILLATAQATMGWIMVKVDLMTIQERGSVLTN